MNRYPEDDSFKDLKKLLAFCPKLKKNCLIKGLRDALGYSTDKISKILNFIEYDVPKKESKCNKRKDLWCHPIVLLNNGDYVFLVVV